MSESIPKSYWERNEAASLSMLQNIEEATAPSSVDGAEVAREYSPDVRLEEAAKRAAAEAFGEYAAGFTYSENLELALKSYLDAVRRSKSPSESESVPMEGARAWLNDGVLDAAQPCLFALMDAVSGAGDEAVQKAKMVAYDRFAASIDAQFPEGRDLWGDKERP